MALRIFRCRDCGHRMRLSGTRCGRCSYGKPGFQQNWALVWALLGLAGLVSVFLT